MALSQSINELYRKYPIATVCVGLSVLVLGGFFFRYSELDARTAALETQRSDAEALRRNVRNAGGLKGHVDQLKAGLTTLDTRTIKESDLNNNLSQFYRVEEKSGIKLTVNQGKEDDRARAARKSKYVMVPFSITGTGTFPQVLSALRTLETGPIEYRPIRMRVLGDNKTDGTGVTLDLYLEFLGTP